MIYFYFLLCFEFQRKPIQKEDAANTLFHSGEWTWCVEVDLFPNHTVYIQCMPKGCITVSSDKNRFLYKFTVPPNDL